MNKELLPGCGAIAYNEQVLLQVGNSLNVPPGLQLNNDLKDEDKNLCLALFVGWDCC